MRSAAGKTRRKLQLDLPLDQGGVDPTSSVHSVSSASRTGVTPDVRDTFVATSIAGQPDRPISFPIDPECVVATLPEEPSRETKLPAATDTDTNGNPYHALESDHTTGPREFLAPRSSRSLIDSSTGTDEDAAASTCLISISAWLRLLPLLRELRRAVDHERTPK